MQEFMYEDGSEVGLNKSEFISLTEVERLTDPENPHESLRFGGDVLFMDEDLTQYEEYIGCASDGNKWRRTDGFVFKLDGAPAMMIYFSYFSRNKETILPVFLEVARNIKYLSQPLAASSLVNKPICRKLYPLSPSALHTYLRLY